MSNKTYDIHDNGGVPFTVTIQQDGVKIVITKSGKAKFIRGLNIWVPKGLEIVKDTYKKNKNLTGNTLLLQIGKNKYVQIGMVVQEFIIRDDTVDSYFSPVGNNDVPYPWILGKNYIYLINPMDSKTIVVIEKDYNTIGGVDPSLAYYDQRATVVGEIKTRTIIPRQS